MKNVYYKLSINIGPFNFYENSKVYEIKEGRSSIIPGLKYSLVTILLGWWGYPGVKIKGKLKNNVSNTFEALRINFSGGIEIPENIEEPKDSRITYIWNNLTRNTIKLLKPDELDIILEIQQEFSHNSDKIFEEENYQYLLTKLDMIDINHITREIIADIFDAIQIFDNNFA